MYTRTFLSTLHFDFTLTYIFTKNISFNFLYSKMHKTKCFNLNHYAFEVIRKNKYKYALHIIQIRKYICIKKSGIIY